HPQAQVDARDARLQADLGRVDVEAAADHPQLAQAFQVLQWIGLRRVVGLWQAADRPAAVILATQGQRRAAQAQLGEGAARQQAGVERDQHFGLADLDAAAISAGATPDAQAVQLQQRAAPGPAGAHLVERHRAPGLLAEPGRDPLWMA